MRTIDKFDRIIAFTSYYFAQKAEAAFKQYGIEQQLIATPPSLHNMCGLCILFSQNDLKTILEIMKNEKISHSGIFTYKGVHTPCEKIEIKN